MKKLLLWPLALLLFAGALLFLLPIPALAADSGYDIIAFNVDIRVGQDNTLHVTEKISVDFHEARHGIIQSVPYRQRMNWTIDGEAKSVLYNTKVKNVVVAGAPFSTYRESGDLMIKIGDPDRTVTGPQDYTVTFDHYLGSDKIDSRDFLYYNLIGTGWTSTISNVTFSVTMPKDFDSSQIWFFGGAYGDTGEAPVTYETAGNSVSGSFDQTLQAGQGLTIEIDLPQGYFETPAPFPWQTALLLLSLSAVLGAFYLFMRYGRDSHLVAPVEFYAPEGITPAETGYIIDTTVDDKDVVSLVIFWANGGYLTIERMDNKEDFIFTKLKDLPATASKYEKAMFAGLFDLRENVTTLELKGKFYETVRLTKSLLVDHYALKENRIFGAASQALGWLARSAAFILVWLALFVATYELTYLAPVALGLALAGALLLTAPFVMLTGIDRRWLETRRLARSGKLLLTIILAAAVVLLFVIYLVICAMPLAGLAVAGAAVFLNIIAIFMRKRTKRGSELLGKVLGFKNFLERAEKDRIEKLVEENPSYFYDVLPYAYVLGVTDKWAKNFEGLAVNAPSWYRDSYDPGGVFSPLIFQASLFSSMNTMGSAMAFHPGQEMGSGGFGGGSFGGGGGGGFSGGGFGGGGGGSW